MTQPVRVGSDLFESARRAGAAQERSTAQQISHWARIGRELEASSALTVADHRRLVDAAAYDDMSPTDQALVRAQWEAAIGKAIDRLDLRARLAEMGKRFVVVGDDQGAARKETTAKKRAPKRTAAKKRVSTRAKA